MNCNQDIPRISVSGKNYRRLFKSFRKRGSILKSSLMNIKTNKMNLLSIYYFADYKLWKEELEEKYMCSFKSLKGLTKNQVNEEVQYLQCNSSGYFRSKQKGKRRSKSSGKFKTFLHK